MFKENTLLNRSVAGIICATVVVVVLAEGSLARSASDTGIADQTGSAFPVRLQIPKIGVDAVVEQVTLTSSRIIGAPKGSSTVGWFMLGPRPGEKGSAVIDGHSGWKDGIPAVFDNLHTLRVGDQVFVKDERGITTAFVVREIRTYGKDEVAPDVFASSDGKAHLNLITCTGVWDNAGETLSERLVVFTDKAYTSVHE